MLYNFFSLMGVITKTDKQIKDTYQRYTENYIKVLTEWFESLEKLYLDVYINLGSQSSPTRNKIYNDILNYLESVNDDEDNYLSEYYKVLHDSIPVYIEGTTLRFQNLLNTYLLVYSTCLILIKIQSLSKYREDFEYQAKHLSYCSDKLKEITEFWKSTSIK